MILKKKSYFSLCIAFLIIIINIPKINLIPIFLQGVRIDDFLILLFLIFNFNKISFSKDSLLILVYITFSYLLFFFHLFEFAYEENYKHLYYLKFIQYFLLYSVLVKNITNNDIIKVIILSAIFQFVYGFIQYLLLSPQLSFTINSRAIGTTAGPWELSIIYGLFFFIIFDYFKNKKLIYIILFFLFFLIIIFVTYSRIAFVGLFFVYLLFGRHRIIFLNFLLIASLVITYFEIYLNIGYFSLSRSYNFFNDFFDSLFSNFLRGDYYFGGGGNFYDPTNVYYDASLVSRLQQWGRYLHTFNTSTMPFVSYLFGNGPGGNGDPHTDGMYIKLLVDFGIIGLIIYFFLMIKYYINNTFVRPGLIFISICCLTVDFYWASKIAYTLILFIIFFTNKNKSLNER
jgi:uncharacterized MnhB-related membrane protein